MASLTDQFAQIGNNLSFAHLSQTASRRAIQSIADAIGCMLAGSASTEALAVRSAALADGGVGTIPIFGTEWRLPPSQAALVNATAGHAHDFDDSLPAMIGHPSVPMVAAMLSVAEGRMSGREMIAGFSAGIEIAGRLGRIMNPAHYGSGWHATATLGTLAATLAAARVARLGHAQIVAALGIAASSSSGIRKNFGSMVKPLHAGLAARNGVVAVQLARAGLRADPSALDGANGFLECFAGETTDVIRDGGPLEIEASGICIKRYPCCGCTHSAVDALLDLRGRHDIRADAIRAIRCTVNGLVPDILVHHRPVTPAQAKFSMEYCLAVAALDGACGLDQFEPERVVADDVQSLLPRVELEIDPAIVYRNGVYPGSVTVELHDGSVFVAHAEEPRGHPDVPLTAAELETKFRVCARRAIGDAPARQLYAALARLEEIDDVRALVDQFATTTLATFSERAAATVSPRSGSRPGLFGGRPARRHIRI